ncbi:MAG: T9SS type A sorting domain-containing protein, partial [Candidatus Kapabacteria bacterium]|nr:T9SS type A sorting domain-containing protein [Candidatus Kapabacteria bacterium]
SSVERDKLQGFSVAPVPASNMLTITVPDGISSLQIISAFGKEIRSIENVSSSNAIDVSTMESGVYYVRAIRYGKTYVQKFVVTR